MTPAEQFQVDPEIAVERGSEEPALIVDVEGFEGPLDLLLMLARQQKVDLAKISILALADQYLAFIEAASQVRLELAADYLVMAASLALRLKRLEAIRGAAERLVARPQLERDVFRRGAPEPIVDVKRPEWTATLYDLLSAYAAQRQKHALARVRVPQRRVWSLAEARAALERLVGASDDWSRLDAFLIAYVTEPGLRATVYASSFAATLEMVREGLVEIHQHAVFAPIYLRKRTGQPNGAGGPDAAATKAETNGEKEGRG